MILDDIVKSTKQRVKQEQRVCATAIVKQQAIALTKSEQYEYPFFKALQESNMNFICEIKKASPSKGIICEDFDYLRFAKEYEMAGANAISVLTEPQYFLGSKDYLQAIAKCVNIPILCKDFIIEPYQIYQAKIWGASAILLICAILDDKKLAYFHKLATKLGLSCLVETHDAQEINRALAIGAKIIGVNNRNLKDFSVDFNNSINLSKKVPKHCILVAESGIKNEQDIRLLRAQGISVVLIGELLMRAQDKIKTLESLYGKTIRPDIKICGITSDEEVEIVNKYNPDYIGFVFAKSKRQIDLNTAKQLQRKLNLQIKKVGVFVDADIDTIVKYAQDLHLDIIQLHGQEDTSYIKALTHKIKLPIWKALKISTQYDDFKIDRNVAMYIFDSDTAGSGTVFDWHLLKPDKRNFILAGGLNQQNILRAIRMLESRIIDISTGVEVNGKKNEQKIKQLVNLIRKGSFDDE